MWYSEYILMQHDANFFLSRQCKGILILCMRDIFQYLFVTHIRVACTVRMNITEVGQFYASSCLEDFAPVVISSN